MKLHAAWQVVSLNIRRSFRENPGLWIIYVTALLFGFFVWPTPYEYRAIRTDYKFWKINRFTGNSEVRGSLQRRWPSAETLEERRLMRQKKESAWQTGSTLLEATPAEKAQRERKLENVEHLLLIMAVSTVIFLLAATCVVLWAIHRTAKRTTRKKGNRPGRVST